MRLIVPLTLALVTAACNTEAGWAGSGDGGPPPPPPCSPRAASETACSDGVDDDCDGFADCLDDECNGMTCGSEAGLTCTSGACRRPCDPSAGNCIPEVPATIENVRVTMHGTTAIVEFEPVEGARDYRIYPVPRSEDVLVGENGAFTIRNGIYRCAGDFTHLSRADTQYYGPSYDVSISGPAMGFVRSEADSILGYVYLTPRAGRTPVYEMTRRTGYRGTGVVPFHQWNMQEYVAGTAERDRFAAMGFIDSGIAFYVDDAGTRPVYRLRNVPDPNQSVMKYTAYYVDGPERTYRESLPASQIEEPEENGERFRILAEQAPGSVPLHRVFYGAGPVLETYDALAAGEARFQQVWREGAQPIPSLTWPNVTEPTTFHVEALDQGCPFPGGYIAAHHAARSDQGELDSITLDEARIETTEVFVNGQHDSANRPRPIARASVTVSPEATPSFDWHVGFDTGEPWSDLVETGIDPFFWQNDQLRADTSYGCTTNTTFGPLLGQLAFGIGDWGSSCNLAVYPPETVEPVLAADQYLHLRMSTDIPASFRRYPQIIVSTVPVVRPGDVPDPRAVSIYAQIGNPDLMAMNNATIVVQPFGTHHEMQIELCDRRYWAVNRQCPRANVYGPDTGNYMDPSPYHPVPILGDYAGYDRPVQFDVWVSTERVYVQVEGRNTACAVIPPGVVRPGPASVGFGAVLYHSGADDEIRFDPSPMEYWRQYSVMHSERRFDDLGIELRGTPPAWDESILPCGTRYDG